jgi:NAD(P)H-dependent FMN reductase
MEANKLVLGFVGSPNREGRTNQLVRAALEGAARAGASTELVQMADHVVAACKDCLSRECQENLKCTFEDPAFEHLSEKVLNCGALVLGTPVYFWDTSGMVKYFILKMFRVYAPSAPLKGLPALGISIAGGTGNGLISGLRPVYHFFQMLQMRALEPLPATRFNFSDALRRAGELGSQLPPMTQRRNPFTSLEERILWYDSLPYLGLTRTGERRFLADLTTMALPTDRQSPIPFGLARAEALSAAGRQLESLKEVTSVYESGVKAFEGK